MRVTATLIGQLKARIAAAKASAPPRVIHIERASGESATAWARRIAGAERKVAEWQAAGRRAFLIAMDTENGRWPRHGSSGRGP